MKQKPLGDVFDYATRRVKPNTFKKPKKHFNEDLAEIENNKTSDYEMDNLDFAIKGGALKNS